MDQQPAYANAVRNGVIVIVAAGNSDRDADGFNPACYGGSYITGHSRINFDPAVMTGGIVAVGATNSWGALAYFSNYGPAVTINAPG